MKMLTRAALVLSALCGCALARPAAAATPLPQCMNAGGSYVPCSGVAPVDGSGNVLNWTDLKGGPAKIANGDDVALGNTADAAYADNQAASPGTAIALLKGAFVWLYQIFGRLGAILAQMTATGAGASTMQGSIAAGAAETGNPLSVGCLASVAVPAITADGNRQRVWCGRNGQLIATLGDTSGSTVGLGIDNADNQAAGRNGLAVVGRNLVWTGSGWDRAHVDGMGFYASGKAIVSASLTAAGTVGPFTPIAHRVFHAIITGSGSGTCELQAKVDGTNWVPFQTVQGSSLFKVSYAGSPVNELPIDDQAATPVQWSCTSVSGTIVPGFSQ